MKIQKGKWNCKKVVCIETGKVWESRRACAKEIGCTDVTVANVIRFGDAFRGRHYADYKEGAEDDKGRV